VDPLVSSLLSARSLELALCVAILVFLVRRTVETAFPSLKKAASETSPGRLYSSHAAAWWNQVILYVLPVAWAR
jgi:hypothetical protein